MVQFHSALLVHFPAALDSFNYKPGSKNWAINTDIVIDELKSQYEPVENLKNITADHEHRMSRVEMDLERMNAIINMYKEFASIHKQEHATYGWTEHVQTGTNGLK
jgi:hypothetical protein